MAEEGASGASKLSLLILRVAVPFLSFFLLRKVSIGLFHRFDVI